MHSYIKYFIGVGIWNKSYISKLSKCVYIRGILKKWTYINKYFMDTCVL